MAKSDIHAALMAALCEFGAGRDRHHRLMLADEAMDMLASHLAPASRKAIGAIRGWLLCRTLPDAQAALKDAAESFRLAVLPADEDAERWIETPVGGRFPPTSPADRLHWADLLDSSGGAAYLARRVEPLEES